MMNLQRFLILSAPWLFVVMWATGFVVSRLSAGHVDPFTFLSLRFPIAGLIFVAIAHVTSAKWPTRRLVVHATVAGALMHGAYLGPIYWAVAHGMPAGVSALIIGLQPLLTAFLAALILQDVITPRHWGALTVGMLGIALVITPKLSFELLGGITPATTAACLFAAVAIALGTVYQKRFATGIDLATGGVWQYLGGTLVVGFMALSTENLMFDGSFSAWFALAWSVIVLSLGAVTLLMILIRAGEISRVSSLIFLVPAVAALMTYALFDEQLNLIQIVGMAVCAGAVFMANQKPARQI
jgi:drug/metabolite transporter (DMT)-like permease